VKISFITTNAGKYKEVKSLLLGYDIEVLWVKRKYEEDTDDTIEDTAKKAARKLADELNSPIILEDTGLFLRHIPVSLAHRLNSYLKHLDMREYLDY